MRHGCWIRNTSAMRSGEALELAVAAEAGGWDGVFVSDAVAEDHGEPFTLLAAFAAVTERVTLGTWVTPIAARNVLAVARSAAVVDDLSDGRLLLGVGLGNQVEHRATGVHETGRELGARYDASVEVLSALLAGETVTRPDHGFDLDEVSLNVATSQDPRPPILCAVSWPHRPPVRRAARWDGMMPQWPGLSEGADPEVATGARAGELRELMAAYREEGGDGDVVVPSLTRFGAGYTELCVELGVTWLLCCDQLTPDDLRQGPPA